MDVTDKIFLIEKHHLRRNKKKKLIKVRRKFLDLNAEGLRHFEELARTYAAQRHEDFLIVKVLMEVPRPSSTEAEDGPVIAPRSEPVRGCSHAQARVLASGSGVMVMRCQDACQAFVVQYAKDGRVVGEWTLGDLAEVLEMELMGQQVEKLAGVNL